jgi:hypothetical protein
LPFVLVLKKPVVVHLKQTSGTLNGSYMIINKITFGCAIIAILTIITGCSNKEHEANVALCARTWEFVSKIKGDTNPAAIMVLINKSEAAKMEATEKGISCNGGVLVGESKSANSSAQSRIPTLTVAELIALSKNETDEIERRCLGVAHPTCLKLKSESYSKSFQLEKSFCDAGSTMDKIVGTRNTNSEKCKKFR